MKVQGYITLETLVALGREPNFDELLITVAENAHDRRHILSVTEEVKAQVARSGRTVYGEFVPVPGEHWGHNNVQSMLFLLNVIGILALLLSGFLVINTTSALLTQQIRQIGVMKAIGARRRQLVGIYLGAVLLYGLLALIFAVPLGALGARWLSSFAAGLLNFDIASFAVAPGTLGLEIMVALLIPVLAALYPVLAGTRVTVHEAVNSYGLSANHFGRGLLDRLLHLVRGLSRPLLLSLRNTFRRKGRLALVLTTLILAGAIFMSVLSVQSSLRHTLDDAMRYWQYDIGVGFAQSYRLDELERVALSAPNIVDAEGWGFKSVVRMRTPTEQSDSIVLVAPPTDTDFIDPILLDGRWLHPDDGNALVINTDLLKDEPDLQVGGDMVLRIDGRETTWTIIGLIKQPLSGPFAYVNYPVFARATREINKVNNVRVVTARHSPRYQAHMAQLLEVHFAERGFHVNALRTTSQERQQTANLLNIVVSFLLVMALLLAVVGGLGLMGVMSINVMERTREVGVMRAIGASNGSLLLIVIVEGAIIGLLSWLLGALVAWPLGQVLSAQVGQLFLGTPASYTFARNGVALWLGIILVIAVLASLWPARNAVRVTVREALVYQ